MSDTPARRWAGVTVTAGLLVAAIVPLTSAHGSHGGASAFSRLVPGGAPKTWRSATIASGGASLFYPSNWKAIPGDKGTVTVALRSERGLYRGYLNVTPREGAERLGGWAAFRTARNRDEGDTRVRRLAAVEGLRLGGTRGSWVIDDYLSRVASHPYRELACIVAGRHSVVVFVGATLRSEWTTLGGAVKRAASALVVR